jgi:hypothetical protein
LLETGNRQQQTLGGSFMKQLSSFEVYNWTRWFFDFCFDCFFFLPPLPKTVDLAVLSDSEISKKLEPVDGYKQKNQIDTRPHTGHHHNDNNGG